MVCTIANRVATGLGSRTDDLDLSKSSRLHPRKQTSDRPAGTAEKGQKVHRCNAANLLPFVFQPSRSGHQRGAIKAAPKTKARNV